VDRDGMLREFGVYYTFKDFRDKAETISCVVFEIKQDFGRKNDNFS